MGAKPTEIPKAKQCVGTSAGRVGNGGSERQVVIVHAAKNGNTLIGHAVPHIMPYGLGVLPLQGQSHICISTL
jgi:hypothetical protein